MNKAELVAAIANKTELNKKQSEEALVAFLDTVKETLAAGDKVQIMGFGNFEVTEMAERVGRNPQTNEQLVIPARRSPKFKPAKALKDLVNAK